MRDPQLGMSLLTYLFCNPLTTVLPANMISSAAHTVARWCCDDQQRSTAVWMGGALLMDWLLRLGCTSKPSLAQGDAELALAQLLTAGESPRHCQHISSGHTQMHAQVHPEVCVPCVVHV